jgi:ATP synthase protein I
MQDPAIEIPMSQMTQMSPTGPASVSPFAAMLGASMIPMLVSAPVIVLAFLVTRQSDGGLASLLGVGTAVAFFASGLLAVTRLTRANPFSVLVVAVSVYAGQVLVLGVVILSLSRATWLDATAFALSVLVVALVWQLSLIRAFILHRKPVYDRPAEIPLNEPAELPEQQRFP